MLRQRMIVPPADRDEAARLHRLLGAVQASSDPLPGLVDEGRLEVFVGQIVESQRRVRYIRRLLTMHFSPSVLDGSSASFDPLKAAILKQRTGDIDEAIWLIFLSTHFGRHIRTGWQLAGDFYSRLGEAGAWDWRSTSGATLEMRAWLDMHYSALRARGGRFGNHRKYESLNAWESTGTGQVLETYIAWVGDAMHRDKLAQIAPYTLQPRERFAALYRSLDSVARFGRTARFDFLCMLGKMNLTNIEADSAYLSGATGPLAGARLLLDGSKDSTSRPRDLEARLEFLQQTLLVPFDVLEDALCNWQKSPNVFVPFRG